MLIVVICYKIKQKLASIHCDRYKTVQAKFLVLNCNMLRNTGQRNNIQTKNIRSKMRGENTTW